MTVSVPMAPPAWYWQAFLIALAAPLLVGIVSPLPFAFFLPFTSAIFILGHAFFCRNLPRFDWPLLGWVAALGMLGCASSLWSIAPEGSLERGLKISLLLLVSLPLIDLARACPPESLKRLWIIFPFLTLAVGIAAAIELNFRSPMYHLIENIPEGTRVNPSVMNKTVSLFTLMLPVSLVLCLRHGVYTLTGLLLLVTGILVSNTESQASQIALLVMPFAGLTLFVLPVAGIPLVFAATAFVMLLMPFLAPIAFDMFAQQISTNKYLATQASASMRLENWDFIARRIIDNPWTGFGMDATRSIKDFETQRLFFKSNVIMHPHNLALQVWIEFGIIGAIAFTGFLGFLLRRLLKMPKPEQRLPFMLFCGVMVFLMISWSVWSAWLLALMVYLAVLMTLAAKTTSGPATS